MSSSSWTNRLMTVPITPITVSSIVSLKFHSFSVLWQGPGTYLSFHFPSVFTNGQLKLQCTLFGWLSLWLTFTCLIVWLILDDPFVSQNIKIIFVIHFLGWILDCEYRICLSVNIQYFCTIPSWSPSPRCRI